MQRPGNLKHDKNDDKDFFLLSANSENLTKKHLASHESYRGVFFETTKSKR
jgi:hypothetical protein